MLGFYVDLSRAGIIENTCGERISDHQWQRFSLKAGSVSLPVIDLAQVQSNLNKGFASLSLYDSSIGLSPLMLGAQSRIRVTYSASLYTLTPEGWERRRAMCPQQSSAHAIVYSMVVLELSEDTKKQIATAISGDTPGGIDRNKAISAVINKAASTNRSVISVGFRIR